MNKIIKQQISRKQGLVLEPIFGAEIMGLICPVHFVLFKKLHTYITLKFYRK